MTDDRQLLRLYADERSDSAFAELARRHVDLVYSAALRRLGGDPHRASEVTQQVFLSLARHAATVSRGPVLAAWLYTVTRNAAFELLRRESRRTRREQTADLAPEMSLLVSPDADWERLKPVLDAALDALSEREREAVLLRFFENRSYPEIGTRLAIAADAARMRVDRALDKLRAELSRRGIASTSAALGLILSEQAVLAAPASLAVAAAAAGTAVVALPSAAALLTLMATSKLAASVGLIAAALAIGAATYESVQNHRDQSEVSRLRGELAVAATQYRELHLVPAPAAPSPPARPAPTSIRKKSGRRQGRVPPQARADIENGVTKGRALEALHPEIKRLVRDQFTAATIGAYQLLFSQLQLSPEQIERFVEIKNAGFIMGLKGPSDVYTFSFADNPSDPGQFAPQLRALLGDGGYAAYTQYDKDGFSRTVAQEVAGEAAASSAPLSPAQTAAVVQALSGLQPFSIGSYDWNQAAARAAATLTPDQMAVFEACRQQTQFNAELAAAEGWFAPPPLPPLPGSQGRIP